MITLQSGDKVALAALSNGLSDKMAVTIEKLCETLEEMGLQVVRSNYLFAPEGRVSASGRLKAEEFMEYYQDLEVKAVFDVSGGDIANEVLGELRFNEMQDQHKIYFGYSDLTTIVNAVYSQTGRSSCLYQVRNLVGTFGREQQAAFRNTLFEGRKDLLSFQYEFLQGNALEGIVVGGNIRCFLKLAGTRFMPDFKKKILFLESRSGGVAQMMTFLNQYKQMGVFEEISGLILGNFTQMESERLQPTIEDLVLEIVNRADLPIIKTSEIGHGADSKAIMIGEMISLK